MLCLCAWSEWFYLSLITVKYVEEKSFQRRLQCRWQLFKSPTAPECMCVTATIWNIPLCFCAMCVGSCQKVYPIITDSYHYHFLSLWSLPLIQLIKSANVNIHFNLQSCLIGPVEPHCQSSCQRKPNYWQAWQPANQNGRWALLHWPIARKHHSHWQFIFF